VFRWSGARGVGGDGEERVGEHGQGDVPVPGAVAADLVVVKADLVLRLAEAVLDSPCRSSRAFPANSAAPLQGHEPAHGD